MSMRNVSGVSPGRSSMRHAVLLLMTLSPAIGAHFATAASLPQELLNAAATTSPDGQWRKKCAQITIGITDGTPDPSIDIHRYTIDAHGVYLGQISAGISAGPFIQALIDAGAAERLRLIRDRQPPMDVFVLSGKDEGFFQLRPGAPATYGSPPALDATGAVPAGLRTASHICWTVTADRVVEYADPVQNSNGTRWAAASIVFRADALPTWITDWRVIQALSPEHPAPRDVENLLFRDDGDGWRPAGQAGAMWDAKHWHSVEPGDDGKR